MSRVTVTIAELVVLALSVAITSMVLLPSIKFTAALKLILSLVSSATVWRTPLTAKTTLASLGVSLAVPLTLTLDRRVALPEAGAVMATCGAWVSRVTLMVALVPVPADPGALRSAYADMLRTILGDSALPGVGARPATGDRVIFDHATPTGAGPGQSGGGVGVGAAG